MLQLIREKYSGTEQERFGPTLAAEHLADEDGLEEGEEDGPPRSYAAQGRRTHVLSSNRDQENLPLMRFSSIIYGREEPKRWDTTDSAYQYQCCTNGSGRKHLGISLGLAEALGKVTKTPRLSCCGMES